MIRLALCSLVLSVACGSDGPELPVSNGLGPAPFDPGETYAPAVTSGDALSAAITNPFFPAAVGTHWEYEATTDEGTERIVVDVLAETRDVWGFSARVVRDTVYLNDEMIEDTWDWYGQDADGNVWYVGEETYEYEGGEVVCSCGAWETGVDGALPGVLMLADPQVGMVYREEYYAGEAEDLAEIVSINETVTVAAGTFEGCVQTRNLSALEPIEEFKFHCPGVGTVLEVEDDERVELTVFTAPTPE